MQTRRRQSRAFTLIELMATIAIIGVLSALCVAGLNKARIRAYEVQDVSSLRQLGIAYNLMMNDLSEVRPNDFFDPTDKLHAYTSDSVNESAAWDDRVSKTAAARKLLSSAYWRKLNAGIIPANEQYPRSYSVNETFFPEPPPESGQPSWERLSVRPIKILSQPRLVLLFMTFAGNTPGIASKEAANPIYSGINNVGWGGQFGRTPLLFVDGSALVPDLAREYKDDPYWIDKGKMGN